MPETHISTALQKEINTWMHVPYKYGGNDKNGVDCSGFVCQIYKSVYKKNVPRTSKLQYENCKKISRNQLQEGDLVFFKIESKSISHVGIYLSGNKFVHASGSKGVIVSDLNEAYFKRAFVGGGRM